MSVIEWKEPPASGAGGTGMVWEAIVAACQARPGEWALVGEHVTVAELVRRCGS